MVINERKSEDYDALDIKYDINEKGEVAYIAKKNNQWFFIRNQEKRLISNNPDDVFGTIKYMPFRNDFFYLQKKRENQKTYLIVNHEQSTDFDFLQKCIASAFKPYLIYSGIIQIFEDKTYQSDIYINFDNGNGKYKYNKIFNMYYDDTKSRLRYIATMLDDLKNIYIMEEEITEK